MPAHFPAEPADDQWGGEGADDGAHVGEGATGVAALVVGGVEPADPPADVDTSGLSRPVPAMNQPQVVSPGLPWATLSAQKARMA
ncbi:hypothetical protein DY245_27810 [Streptomyces inhibens]|uniref:Uncharacterized protein n=1 Tax=Streptomyces inhibens TaxID=2293571 RepID=A0A371PXN7_STRIH|nr:hypothetical protein DY245_27810 [Streptomyces inhibens]